MTMAAPKRRGRGPRKPEPLVEAALQDAFSFCKIHDDETRYLIRCVLLAYEVAKAEQLKGNGKGKRAVHRLCTMLDRTPSELNWGMVDKAVGSIKVRCSKPEKHGR